MPSIRDVKDLISTPYWWPLGEKGYGNNQTENERIARSRSIGGTQGYYSNAYGTHNSFSGADIVAYIHIPPQGIKGEELLGPYTETEAVVGVLGTLQTISYSTFRDVQPVRTLGKTYSVGYTRGPRCIPASEMVYVKGRGMISIADVRVGDEVQSSGFEFNRVKGSFNQGKKDCTLITLGDGYTLKASYDHPIYTTRGWVKAGKLSLNDIVYICGSTPSHDIDLKIEDDILKLIAYLIGDDGICIYEKNNKSKEYRITLTIADSEDDVIGRETSSILNRLNIPFKDYRHKDNKSFDRRISVCLRGHNKTDYRLRKYNLLHEYLLKFDLYNTYSHTKFIPHDFLHQLSSRQIVLFLNRLFSTDGGYCISKDKKYIEFKYTSTSEVLINQIRLLLSKIGLSSIQSKELKIGRTGGKEGIVSRYDAFNLKISNSLELVRFIKRIGVFGKDSRIVPLIEILISRINNDYIKIKPKDFWKKVIVMANSKGLDIQYLKRKYGIYNNKLKITPRRAKLICTELNDVDFNTFIDKLIDDLVDLRYDFVTRKVNKLENIGELDVYDLEVDKRHSFICNYIKVHNTVAGTIVWTTMDQYVLAEALKFSYVDDYDPTTILIDQIPPFNIIITFNNEYGDVATMGIYGVRMINEGSTFSIDDMITEQTNTYIASDIDMMHKGPSFKKSKTLPGLKRGTDVLLREAKRRMNPHGSTLQ